MSFFTIFVILDINRGYWIPVFNSLKQNGIKPILIHPKYVKQAKGQKTDFRDAVHMASMFCMVLAAAPYIPPADIRDLRKLCRYRLKLTYMRTSEKNRFQNSMTISKVRLDSVFSDPFGKSASAIMEYTSFQKSHQQRFLPRIFPEFFLMLS